MTPLEIQCHTILLAASTAEFGLVVKTNDPYRARASLYGFRTKLGDPELATLQIRVSPNDSEQEIWIIRPAAVAPTFAMESLL